MQTVREDLKSIFRIRRGEWVAALTALLVIAVFQYLMISKFFGLFADYSPEHWKVFMNNFHMSGFDPITYSVVTDWNVGYNIIRHPLLPFLMLPLYGVNQLLWWLTGANCVQLVVGCLLVFCAFYSFLFIYRIMHGMLGAGRGDAWLLSLLFFGFAYVLVAVIVPDHFCLSLFLILLTLCRAGMKMQAGARFSLREIMLLFVLTAGVTLSNGVITGLSVLAVNGMQTFRRKVVLSVGGASLLLLAVGFGVNALLEQPGDQQVGRWTDTSISRQETLVENFFGESIQLHRRYVLGDVLTRRPVFVKYTWKAQYAVEALVVLLFGLGVYAGRRQRLMQLAAACFLYAVLLHLVLGFAITEVYIMSAHWIYVIPMAMACLFAAAGRKQKMLLRIVTALLVVYLWTYHGVLLYRYLTWPLAYA